MNKYVNMPQTVMLVSRKIGKRSWSDEQAMTNSRLPEAHHYFRKEMVNEIKRKRSVSCT